MFSKADLDHQTSICTALEAAGFTTFVPHRDGIEIARVMGDINNPPPLSPKFLFRVHDFVRKHVFSLDIYQLMERCQAVVFNIDGRVPDDGSVMEASVGWAAGKPLVIYKTTPITMLGGYDNPMLAGLAMGWADVNDVADLPRALETTVAQRRALGGSPFVPDAHAQKVIALGRAVAPMVPGIHRIADLDPMRMEMAIRKLMDELAPLVAAATEPPSP